MGVIEVTEVKEEDIEEIGIVKTIKADTRDE